MAYSFDGPTKVISLSAGTTEISVPDMWSRWVDWYLTGDNSKYGIWMDFVGGDPIDLTEGTSIPIYLYLASDTTISPDSANHELVVKDGILLKDGGGQPFNDVVGYTVRIKYQQPVQALTVSTSGSTLTADDVWQALYDNNKDYPGSMAEFLKKLFAKTNFIAKEF